MSLTIGSLFSGIGGLELGLEQGGLGPVLWQAEMDPFCRKVLAQHWPDAKRYCDVREVQNDAKRPDIICGGFPCQDISLAGKGAGIVDGARSGLWREFARIIWILEPRFVVIENVSALRMRGMCEVLRDLAACGYDAEWDCIPASAVGAPHRRDRLYMVAWRVPDAECNAVRYEPERGKGATQEADGWYSQFGHVGTGLANCDGGRREALGLQNQRTQQRAPGDQSDGSDLPVWPPPPDDMHAWGRVPADTQPAVCRMAYGIPDRAHRLRALGNAVVPAVAQVVGYVVAERLAHQQKGFGR